MEFCYLNIPKIRKVSLIFVNKITEILKEVDEIRIDSKKSTILLNTKKQYITLLFIAQYLFLPICL